MNHLMATGNLVHDPQLRSTTTGKSVCTFTIAVNRRKKIEGQPDADFFRVTAWNQMGENCQKYLKKGKKVTVIGPVSVQTWMGQDGKFHAGMEVLASEVEFVSPIGEAPAGEEQKKGFTDVTEAMGDDLPF